MVALAHAKPYMAGMEIHDWNEIEDTAPYVREAMDGLGWGSRWLAHHLTMQARKIMRWQTGKETCPTRIMTWLWAKYQAGDSDISASDLPEGWVARREEHDARVKAEAASAIARIDRTAGVAAFCIREPGGTIIRAMTADTQEAAQALAVQAHGMPWDALAGAGWKCEPALVLPAGSAHGRSPNRVSCLMTSRAGAYDPRFCGGSESEVIALMAIRLGKRPEDIYAEGWEIGAAVMMVGLTKDQ